MNLLAGKHYDPATAVSAAASAAIAVTALDTTNLRLVFTPPPSGIVKVIVNGGALTGAVTYPQILVAILQGSTVIARSVPIGAPNGTALATTFVPVRAEFLVTGLTPGTPVTWDLAMSVETAVASSGWKYGGPNNATANNAWGGISFEIWDAADSHTPSSGAAPTSTVHVKIDAVQADTDNIQTRIPAALVSGRMDSSVGAVVNGVIVAASFAAGALDAVWSTAARLLTAGTNIVLAKGVGLTGFNDITAADVWAAATRRLSDGTNIVLAKGVGVTGLNDLDAAGVRTAVGLASANLDTQLAALATYVDTEVAAIKAIIDKLDTALELDGAVYRFTTNALEQGPAGAGGGGLDAAGVRAAIGLASANLDTQLAGLAAYVDTEVAALGVDVTTLLGRITSGRATLLDNLANLDATITSRQATFAYTAPDNAGITTLLGRLTGTRAGLMDNLDAAISSRMATFAYTAPDNAGIAAVKAKTDKLTYNGTDQLKVDVLRVNNVVIIGSGAVGDRFRAA